MLTLQKTLLLLMTAGHFVHDSHQKQAIMAQETNPYQAHQQLQPKIQIVQDDTLPATNSSGSRKNAKLNALRESDLREGSLFMSRVRNSRDADVCSDRLCYGLPRGCLDREQKSTLSQTGFNFNPLCSMLATTRRNNEQSKAVSSEIVFEIVAVLHRDRSTYSAMGFSETGRMQGLVSECIHIIDPKNNHQSVKLRHSYNIPGIYTNVPVNIIDGVKTIDVDIEGSFYYCRWIVDSAVQFNYEAMNGSIITMREELAYKNYHILLAEGDYDSANDIKGIHQDRTSSIKPVSLGQTGHIKSLGTHILIRIHGSLMIAIWVGLVTFSIVLARYYKNEWTNTKFSPAIWFVAHRALMLISWFGSLIAVIFAFMYTETYHPGVHQVSGTSCLLLSTIQVLGGLFRPKSDSSRRVYFNWTHFICGNLSYLLAMVCLVTAAFLAPAHLPPIYMWIIVAFVGTYALIHMMMTIHQYLVHKSSKISITPMTDLSSNLSASYTSAGFVSDVCPKEVNSPFRQLMLGILVTIIVIYIVVLISLVNLK